MDTALTCRDMQVSTIQSMAAEEWPMLAVQELDHTLDQPMPAIPLTQPMDPILAHKPISSVTVRLSKAHHTMVQQVLTHSPTTP